MKRPPPAKKGEINFHFVDRFTFVHFMIGIFYAYSGFSFFLSLVLAIIWEVIENPLKSYLPVFFPHASGDSFKNSVGDIVAVCGGWLLIMFTSGA